MELIAQVDVEVYSESRHGLPEYAKLYDAGMDVRLNAINAGDSIILYSHDKIILPTGLYFAIPPGLEFQVRPRSGTSYKTNLKISNSPGTIDSGYRGMLGIIVENIGGESIMLQDGDRIAQIVLAPVIKCLWKQVESLDALSSTDRGAGGYGSTGS